MGSWREGEAKIIDSLAWDLHVGLLGRKGLWPRNLRSVGAFAEAWPEEPIVQAALAQITWYHNLALLEKVAVKEERLWYAQQTIQHGWSRNVLVLQIESGLYRRQGQAISNFESTLPKPQSDLAPQILKDPYNFDFLTLHKDARERDIERGLLDHLRQFLLELGSGFAFVGSQVPLSIGKEDYRVDLLFYHLKLRAFIVAEVKAGPFRPEYAGKMNFYLSAVDDLLRHPSDQPSIGLILCRSKEGLVVEYALRDIGKPMGIAELRLTDSLPENLKSSLPSIEELESELEQSGRQRE
ncbi:MAG: PDDEXK nuclease domain-containing protein [Bryobacter sp.]|nr:PDDEXK nuclease domain-containing protein [Bryobacter sp.]